MAFRVGDLAFVSGLPVSWPLQHGLVPDVEAVLVEGLPGQLDELMERGELDAAPISSVAYVRAPERYVLVPELSLSSWGRIGSATLFSRVSLAQLDGQPIALPPDGGTSNMVVRWYLQTALGIQPQYREADAPLSELLKSHAAALVIGDAAILEARRAGELVTLDLGEAWWQLMQTPFVLTVWAVRAELPEPERSALVAALRAAKALGAAHHAEVAAVASQRLQLPLPETEAYYALLNYDLTAAHMQSLDVLGATLLEVSTALG